MTMKHLFKTTLANAQRACLLIVAFGFALLTPDALAQNPAKSKPNILVIIADDLNDWISPMAGHPQARTPNLDKLAARGLSFLNANCAAPICNP
jgi:hypothetical protein